MSEDNSQKQRASTQDRQDRFSQFMFGQSPKRREETQTSQQANQNNPTNQSQEIDFIQIAQQIDSIMTSINQLKPMIKQISPYLNFFKKS